MLALAGAGCRKPITIPGWSTASRWGYDPTYESFWVELHAPRESDRRAVRIGPESLITAVTSLARAIATAASVPELAAELALSA